MSTTKTTSGGPADGNGMGGGEKRGLGRAPVIAVVVAGLVLSLAARQWALGQRARPGTAAAVSASGAVDGVSIGRFDSYALALLLGGLRGPLVMVLWTSSEAQKSERNLEDFDTKVEWIRLLQPEFDSVHIFQVWNKAYNISVQMASLANKYVTIIDAIDYAQKVDDERPHNVNVLTAIAQVYFDKLGNSTEKAYYRQRVRAESLPRPGDAQRQDAGFRRQDKDAVLDERGFLLPQFTTPTLSTPVRANDKAPATTAPSPLVDQLPAVPDVYDGSELQFLKKFEPYPQGISPLAYGYNYYKRAQLLLASGKQKHLQLSDLVIDSRPALSLKTWAEEEWERGRRNEILGYGRKPEIERIPLEPVTADVTPSTPVVNPKAIDDAIYNYDRTVQLGLAALAEYDRHLANFQQSMMTYRAHQDVIKGYVASSEADRDFLKATKLPAGPERTALLEGARKQYALAADIFALSALRYYSDDSVLAQVLPPSVTKYQLEFDPTRPVGELSSMAIRVDAAIRARSNEYDQYDEDRSEYLTYIRRNALRAASISAALGQGSR